jgi:hypothetical protein
MEGGGRICSIVHPSPPREYMNVGLRSVAALISFGVEKVVPVYQ